MLVRFACLEIVIVDGVPVYEEVNDGAVVCRYIRYQLFKGADCQSIILQPSGEKRKTYFSVVMCGQPSSTLNRTFNEVGSILYFDTVMVVGSFAFCYSLNPLVSPSPPATLGAWKAG